jgi:hypothetical protein
MVSISYYPLLRLSVSTREFSTFFTLQAAPRKIGRVGETRRKFTPRNPSKGKQKFANSRIGTDIG